MEVDHDGGDTNPLPRPRLAPPDFQLKATAEEQKQLLGDTLKAHIVSTASLETLFDPFLTADGDGNLADLDGCFLDLKKPNEKFLPKRIFVRQCMRQIFGYYRNDVLEEGSNRVLLGSPGVGKSVLFFIAAFYQAEKTSTMPIIYVRNSPEEPHVSVFVLARISTGVQVYCCRSVEKSEYKTLAHFRKSVASLFGLAMRQCVVFLDGPRHNHEKDLNSYYEYFCTSGGHPLRKNAQKQMFFWVLDGWTRVEAVNTLTAFGHTVEAANEAFSLCGGCIRDMMEYVNGDKTARDEIKADLIALVDRVNDDQIELVLTHTARNNDDDPGNPDRIRMMFNKTTSTRKTALVVQIVDSHFVLYCLRGRLGLDSYFKVMQLGKAIQNGSVVGIYFEEVLHSWFKESLPFGITGVNKPTGTGAEGVLQLLRDKVYWIPSIPNFANIDAAVVIKGGLYTFQYTKRAGHGFDENTFWQEFVSVVRGNIPFDRVHVYIVVIKGISSNLIVNFNRTWTPLSQPTQTRAMATRVNIPCTSSTVSIDTTSAQTVRSSAAAGMSLSLSRTATIMQK